jgi:acyl-[acyl-carrier-protein]-phospholipid O-acyltransferase/long-chain-fatty-acid--[acyl-carrier-protein] ligase
VASKGFLGLLVTQFLVSLNDNMFRWLIIPIGQDLLGERGQDFVLSAGSICFLLPFVVLAAPAGFLADRFSKRSVMIGCKVAEIIIVALGVGAILLGNVYLMLIVLALLASQAALFSPAKMGSIPEIVRPDRISAANGLVGMTTMLAIIFGTMAGGYLYHWTTLQPGTLGKVLPGHYHWWISALALIGVAVAGWVASLFIGQLQPVNPTRPLPRNPFSETVRDLGLLVRHRPLLLAALASAFFWSLGALSQVNIAKLAKPELVGNDQQFVGPLLAILMLGIGLGSLLAGMWSRGKVELGIVPVGAAGISVTAMLFLTVPHGNGHMLSAAYGWSGFWLLALGMAAGMYDIPLQAFLQERSPPQERGVVMAAYNFLSFSGMLLSAAIFWLLASVLGLSARVIFLLCGLATLPVLACMLWRLPVQTLRFLFWRLSKIVYRVHLEGLENIPEQGGALLVSNHVSWIDGIMLMIYSPRPIRMIAYADYVEKGLVGWLARRAGAIAIVPGNRRSVIDAIRTAREAIWQGELVCIFPEGGLTRTGLLQPFHPGFISILRGSPCPLVPVYLGGFWGSIFSFSGGKFFWKMPRRIRYPLSIRFGVPLHYVTNVLPVRQAVEQLGLADLERQKREWLNLPRQMLRICRRNRFRVKVADSLGTELTGAGVLTRTLILRRILRRLLKADDRYVGLLLPPSVAGVVANAAVTLDRRVAVNLNYTVSSEIMNDCIGQCGIRRVLTSRKMMERCPLKIDVEQLFLEDFLGLVRTTDKLWAGIATWLLPIWLLERLLGLTRIRPDDLMTIVFTSGSTGSPKGAMLSHYNIGSNIDAFTEILDLRNYDVMLGMLPFFHSFGYTTTLWSVLALSPQVVYHYSPLEGRAIGQLCGRWRVTILVTAPTFLRCYLRRCEPEDFAALEVVITGAEKLPPKLADEFDDRFKVRPVEGFGTTELSPVVSCNSPPGRERADTPSGRKAGTVGLPLPGVSAKVVDLDTGADLGADKSGMLLVRGPNVMQGYLGLPEVTAQVIRNGWYATGDVAVIDDEGFIRITGRESRFSKIGGEMVPHVRIEEALVKVLSLDDEEQVQTVVTSVPDVAKGERLVVLHTGLDTSPEQVCRRLAEEGLPPLWIPSADSFKHIDAIPVLGSGKLDLKRVKELAAEQFRAGE